MQPEMAVQGVQEVLESAIERGLKEVAVESVTALLKEKEALDVINEEIIPALDQCRKRL